MKKRAENQPTRKPRASKAKPKADDQADLEVKAEAPLPTEEEILAAQKQAIEELAREKLIMYANKIQMTFKGKWFTLMQFQMKFKIPKPDSAQILLALFDNRFLAIDNRAGIIKYKVDFTVDVQLEVVDKELKKHQDQIVKLEAEKQRLIKVKHERLEEVKSTQIIN